MSSPDSTTYQPTFSEGEVSSRDRKNFESDVVDRCTRHRILKQAESQLNLVRGQQRSAKGWDPRR